MNTITHEGNDYEVLSLDDLNGFLNYQLYVQLANGAVMKAEYFPQSEMVGIKVRGDRYDIRKYILENFGIQPLKLLEKVPVEFTDTFAQCVDGKWYPVYSLDDGFGYQRCEQKVFRCVEVTK